MSGLPPSEVRGVVALDLEICRLEIVVQDLGLERQLAALGAAQGKTSEAKRTLRYRIRGSDPFEISEERDRLAQVDGVENAVATVLERGLRRAAELLVLSAWAPFTGQIIRKRTHIFTLIEPPRHETDLLPARHLWVRGEELFAIEVSTSTLSCRVLDLPSMAGIAVLGPAADHDRPKELAPAHLIAHLLRSSPRLGVPRSTLVRAASRLAMLPAFAVAEGSIDDVLRQLPSPSPPNRAM